MKLNKTFLAVAAALPLLSSAVVADTVSTADLKERVFGSLFGEYYMPDTDKTESPDWNYMEKDWGYGVELGYYLTEQWAIRAEYARMEMQSKLDGSDVNGNRYGLDVMYHLPQWSSVYLVGGLKRFDAAQDTTAFNLGLGYKHFFNQNFALYAEANRYQGIDETYGDAGIKLGMTYAFGTAAAKPAPTPAPAPVAPVQAAPVDSDGDGVPDTADKCANTPANHKVDATGCSIFTEKEVNFTLKAQFANDSAEIKPEYRAEIADLAAFLKRFPGTDVEIGGHASNVGTAAYNLKLSERRADAVAKVLLNEHGISAGRVTVKGYGVTRPKVEGNTPAAHAANRRIEAVVTATIKEKVER